MRRSLHGTENRTLALSSSGSVLRNVPERSGNVVMTVLARSTTTRHSHHGHREHRFVSPLELTLRNVPSQ